MFSVYLCCWTMEKEKGNKMKVVHIPLLNINYLLKVGAHSLKRGHCIYDEWKEKEWDWMLNVVVFWNFWLHIFTLMFYSCFFSFFKPTSLKMECDKLAQEKTEMQRHYVMVSKDTVVQYFYFICATSMFCCGSTVKLKWLRCES